MSTLLDAAVFRSELARLRDGGEAADYVLDALGDRFTRADLDEQLDTLQTHMSTRGRAQRDDLADSHHRRAVLCGRIRRRHTAFRAGPVPGDGRRVGRHGGRALRPLRRRRRVGQVLRDLYGVQRIARSASSCWRRPTSSRSRRRRWPGTRAANKGLALFPRRIGGRFAAMSRSDRESNSVAYADDPFDLAETRRRASSRRRRGRRCSWATAARRSKPRPGGWC